MPNNNFGSGALMSHQLLRAPSNGALMHVKRSRLCSLLACLQAEARAHLEGRLRACPEGTAMVTLGRRPLQGSHWLLTRCILGATPQLVQIEVGLHRDDRTCTRLPPSYT